MKRHPNTYTRTVTFCADCNEPLDECECQDDEAEQERCEFHKWRTASFDPRFAVCVRCGEVGRVRVGDKGWVDA